ncbi:hypothetical protein [Chondrinema litorale]|uniref:hypothetical protein n=1 Tax=Chondrinema litorale TaxID=2994555 RepID=UPI002543AA88|nr:hypothetical protein [Chondrinema litorale]UZR94485.1 hypothetical protein OQ292_01460 [Chondrinema litorale]
MKKKLKTSQPSSNSPRVHPDLQGFDIKVNQFGEIESTLPIEEINKFLNKKVVDKKLKDRFGYKSDESDDTVEFMYKSDSDE